MLLTDDERRRFAEYLRRDAESNQLMAEQLGKLDSAPEALSQKKRTLAIAQLIVAKELESAESVTVRG